MQIAPLHTENNQNETVNIQRKIFCLVHISFQKRKSLSEEPESAAFCVSSVNTAFTFSPRATRSSKSIFVELLAWVNENVYVQQLLGLVAIFLQIFQTRSDRLSVTCHNSLRRWSNGIISTFYFTALKCQFLCSPFAIDKIYIYYQQNLNVIAINQKNLQVFIVIATIGFYEWCLASVCTKMNRKKINGKKIKGKQCKRNKRKII